MIITHKGRPVDELISVANLYIYSRASKEDSEDLEGAKALYLQWACNQPPEIVTYALKELSKEDIADPLINYLNSVILN